MSGINSVEFAEAIMKLAVRVPVVSRQRVPTPPSTAPPAPQTPTQVPPAPQTPTQVPASGVPPAPAPAAVAAPAPRVAPVKPAASLGNARSKEKSQAYAKNNTPPPPPPAAGGLGSVLNRGNFRDALGYAAAGKVLDTAGNVVGGVANALNPFARQQGMNTMQGFTTHTAAAETQIMLDAVGDLEKIAIPIVGPALLGVGRAIAGSVGRAAASTAVGAATAPKPKKPEVAPSPAAATPRPTA